VGGPTFFFFFTLRAAPNRDKKRLALTRFWLLILAPGQDDMRQLKKTNRPRVDELIRDGGKQLQEYTSAVQSYTARLLAPPDEFFSSSKQGGGADAVTLNDPASILNGTKPIMYLDMVDDRAF